MFVVYDKTLIMNMNGLIRIDLLAQHDNMRRKQDNMRRKHENMRRKHENMR